MCVCVRMYVYIYIYTHRPMCERTYICMYIYVYMYVFIYVCIYVCMYMYVHTPAISSVQNFMKSVAGDNEAEGFKGWLFLDY